MNVESKRTRHEQNAKTTEKANNMTAVVQKLYDEAVSIRSSHSWALVVINKDGTANLRIGRINNGVTEDPFIDELVKTSAIAIEKAIFVAI